MNSFVLGAFSALWLGMLTSISPCPLATNVLAVSFISRRIDNSLAVFLTGLLYSLGRMLTYIALAALLLAGVSSIPQLANFLQKYMNKILGPVLILTGMILLELIRIIPPRTGLSEETQKRIESMGLLGAVLLGFIFALSFCPLSAALFFGSLIPLSVKLNSFLTLPALYGLGSALPAVLFAVLLALGAKSVAKAFKKLTQLELWFRRATGVIFILIGIYFCLAYIIRLF